MGVSTQSTWGLEVLSCLPSAHSSRCGSRRASTMNLARPSSTGSASDLTVLAGRISEQQCCMEIDLVSKVHRAPKWRDIFTTSLLHQKKKKKKKKKYSGVDT